MRSTFTNIFSVGLVLAIAACGGGSEGSFQGSTQESPRATQAPELTLDPNGVTPLAALIEMETDVPTSVTLEILGGSSSGDITASSVNSLAASNARMIKFEALETVHEIPVLGLLPNTAYTVRVMIEDSEGNITDVTASTGGLNIITAPLPEDFPQIEMITSKPEQMEPGYTLLDKFRRGRSDAGLGLNLYSIILDAYGNVVWYSTTGASDMHQLPNGNLVARGSGAYDEWDLLGFLKNSLPLDEAVDALHHDFTPTVEGTYLSLGYKSVLVDGYPTSIEDPDAPTQTVIVRDDPVVEFAADGTLINEWTMLDILDVGRINYKVLNPPTPDGYDWAHLNAVFHDERDNSIIISSRRHNAVVKFSRTDGSLIWILGAHSNWDESFAPYLFTPIGADFDWQFGQHSPEITPADTLLIFDNGDFRADPLDGNPKIPNSENYSRAVEYSIDEELMEIAQVWEFGLELSPREFSTHMGDADWLETTGNVLVDFPGIMHRDGVPVEDLGYGGRLTRIVEVTHETPAERVFEVVLYNPTPGAMISVYRTERIPALYGPGVLVEPIVD